MHSESAVSGGDDLLYKFAVHIGRRHPEISYASA